MKKLVKAIAALSLIAGLAGCSTGEMKIDSSNAKQTKIEATNASSDNIGTGTIDIAEGEEILINAEVEKGELQISFFNTEQTGDISDLDNLISDDADPSATFNCTSVQHFTSEPGTYFYTVRVLKRFTGTVTIDAAKE